MGFAIGVFAGLFIIVTGDLIISFYNITEETRQIASQLMKAIGFIVIFQSANSIITKGVLRGGGDTKCLMIADNIFLWAVSIPLGYLAGLYFQDVYKRQMWMRERLHLPKACCTLAVSLKSLDG